MKRVAVHLNDAGITLLGGERILYRQPGFALIEDGHVVTGNEAFMRARINPRRIQHRYWSDLGTDAIADQRFRHVTAADLASRQLEQMCDTAGCRHSELIIAVPAYMDTQQLGLLLGITAELGMTVTGLVDASIAATRREYREAVPVHVDMSLHSTSLARLAQPGHVLIESSEVLADCGTYALYDAWLNAVAEAFVQQSRFDPLHTAETEQLLLNRLGGWLTEAASRERIELGIEYAGASYRAEIEALTLIAAAAPVYQLIGNKLRALYRAEEVPAIQMTDRVARMPGLAAQLKARVGGELYVLEAGATARGALARCHASAGEGGGVSLLRQLPWDQSPVIVEAPPSAAAHSGVPTHLLFRNVAYAIGNSPLVLGSQEMEGARSIALETDMPGVSRRHCSLVRQNGQCVLEDHSRYGTFLNGHRINGSSILQVGDTLRIGSPGYEFQMITTDESHG